MNDISDEDIEQLVKSEKGADLLRQIGVIEEDQASIEKAKNQNLGDLKELLKANGMDNLSDSDLSELLTTEYGQQILKSLPFMKAANNQHERNIAISQNIPETEGEAGLSLKTLDKVHSLMSARGMDVPKEALVEILKTPQGKELLMQMKELEKAEKLRERSFWR